MALHPVGLPVDTTRRLEWRISCEMTVGRAAPYTWARLFEDREDAAETARVLQRLAAKAPIPGAVHTRIRHIRAEHRTIWETPWTEVSIDPES